MPQLRHSVEGEEFDIMKSELVTWLVNKAEIRSWLFNTLHGRGIIVYDGERKTWGVAADLVGRMAKKVARPVDEGDLTTEQARGMLEKQGPMGYKDWRLACEMEYGVRVNHWTFWHIVRPLVEASRAFKTEDRVWRTGTPEDRIAAEAEVRDAAIARARRAQAKVNASSRRMQEIAAAAVPVGRAMIVLFPASATNGSSWADVYALAHQAGVTKEAFNDGRRDLLMSGLICMRDELYSRTESGDALAETLRKPGA